MSDATPTRPRPDSAASSTRPEPGPIPKTPLLLLGLLILVFVTPPCFGGHLKVTPEWTHVGWGMYHSHGDGTCDVRYYDAPVRDPNAKYIERWKYLGVERPVDLPAHDRFLKQGSGKLLAAHARVCRGLARERGEPVEVYTIVRCPGPRPELSWVTLDEGLENRCPAPAPAPKKKAKQKAPPKGAQ